MDVIQATPMSFGFITWPIRPPQLTMVLVVKATYDIVDGGEARLADVQRPCHGAVYVDDDAEKSLRLDTDFALLKRAGECLLAGTCHPPKPARVSVVRFKVGDIDKRIAVFGDRRWRRGLLGKRSTEPEPFESMPLRWERAFGGPSIPANPLGRGVAPVTTEEGETVYLLPNLEDPKHPVSAPADRPAPWGAFPIAPTWAARLRHAGTYDQRWTEERFPHLAVDFDPAFYSAAPPDQRLASGFWRGDEAIELENLRPGHPHVTTRLPGMRPRGFLDRAGRLDEVPLVLDTITVDADAGQIYCTWRGAVEVADPRFNNVRHLFLMDQPIGERRSVKSCRRRLRAHLRLDHLVQSGFEPTTPAEEEEQTIALARLQRTFDGDPRMSALLRSASGVVDATVMEAPAAPAAEPVSEEPPLVVEPVDPDAVLAGVYADLAEKGMDVSGLEAPEPPKVVGEELDAEQIEQVFAGAGMEVPDEVRQVLALAAEVEDLRRAQGEEEEPALELGSREEFLLSYAEGRPLVGDFTGIVLDGEELPGLHADGALLGGVSFAGCVLSGASFVGASLVGANLEGADLDGADFTGADLTRARAREAKLTAAKLDDATLEDADLVGANLKKASLVGAEASRANFEGANLEEANLDAAELSRANLTRATVRRASLVDARLSGACCVEADFEEANLEKLRAGFGARFDRALLRGVAGTGARFFGSSLVQANLSLAQLDKADFTQAQLTGALLVGCSLKKSRFVGANLAGAQMVRCDLMKANLLDANLEQADLRGSSFFSAELFRVKRAGAQLELADLTGTKLEGRGP